MSHDRNVRRGAVPLVIALVLLAVGSVVAWGVGGALGLSFTPATVPTEHAAPAPARAVVAPPPIELIAAPDSPRLATAAAAVVDALVARGQARPALRSSTATGPTTGTAATLRVELSADSAANPEAFRISRAGAGLVVHADAVAGGAAGLYAIADRIRSGAAVLPTDQDGVTVAPRLGLRLTDAGSVGREPDVAAFTAGTDYSLNTDIVSGALLPQAPWVDPAAVARIEAQFRQFVDHSLAQGYNGVVLPGFLEYVTFSGVGDGHAIYPAGDPHLARARAMVAAFGPVFRYAHDMGMKVYLLTDMLAVSPPLQAYLERTFGGLAVDDPRLWSVYQSGLAELFDQLSFVDGLMVRIGEGGAVYRQAGWDYSSTIAVTTATSVRAMLKALLATAAAADKDLIFRTWTVGVGAVGDLHTNPDSYREVLGDLDDPHLIVSTKYTLGDFYSHLPLNDTLGVGSQRRIVELQARREFEGFGSLPNDLVGLHQQALQQFLRANPHIEGVWNWTQDGGPLRAGPMSLYLRTGFWPLYDLNTYGTARLAWNPETDPAQITADWARQSFSDDPATVAAIGSAMALSREAITKGLYIGPYAENSVKALGLAPPPMMWIFEWDIVTGDSAALDSIYAVSREQLDAALVDGDRATALATQMGDLIAGTDAASWRDPQRRQSFVDTLAYEQNLFRTLGAYRTAVLRHVQWLDTGSSAAYDSWKQAEAMYRQARDEQVARYGGNLDLPAYNFTAADIGTARADRDPAMAWLARGLLTLVLVGLLLGSPLGRRRLRAERLPGGAALAALWVGATRPWRLVSVPVATSRVDRVLVCLWPAAVLVVSRSSYTWFAAPAHLVLTLGGWLLFTLVLRLIVGRRDPFHLWAAIGGVAILRTVILLVALATRGPGRYWFIFWTDPTRRSIYITVAFAGFAWLFVVTAMVLRRPYGLLRRRSVGATLVGLGATLGLLAGLVTAIGLERALTIWNDQLALLPWGLSRILGITVYLGIPADLPALTAIAGTVIAVAGGLLMLRWRRGGDRPAPGPTVRA